MKYIEEFSWMVGDLEGRVFNKLYDPTKCLMNANGRYGDWFGSMPPFLFNFAGDSREEYEIVEFHLK